MSNKYELIRSKETGCPICIFDNENQVRVCTFNSSNPAIETEAVKVLDGLSETATLHAQLGEARAELLTTHQMACRVGLERDELAKMLETECNTLQVELVEAERKFQDGFDCVPFCELSSAANALLSRIRAALQSVAKEGEKSLGDTPAGEGRGK